MKIAAVGDNCIDYYENLNKAFPGGNPVNVAVYTVRLGGEASYTGVIGNDRYGKIIKDALESKGVDVSHLKTLNGNTAITHVRLENNERVFGDYDEGVLAEFKLTDEDIDFLSSHDIVVTGLWGMIEDSLPDIRKRNVEIAFDFADKLDDPIIEKAINYVDYAFFSYTEDNDYIRKFMKKMYRENTKYVIITLGENGSIVFDGSNYITFGITPCNVVDTMGAGDSYIAGFLRGILLKKTILECMKMGADNISITLQYNGAW